MDPNALRLRILRLVEMVLRELTSPAPGAAILSESGDLAMAVKDLDEWLLKGGFLPQPWQDARDNHRLKIDTKKQTIDELAKVASTVEENTYIYIAERAKIYWRCLGAAGCGHLNPCNEEVCMQCGLPPPAPKAA